MALKKVAFLPYGYLVDKWRFGVFRGSINETNYNQKWWEMREKYQGVKAPVERSEADFDPVSKYHIATFIPYTRYFVSHLLQFQFYKTLCGLAENKGRLHECDFYDSKLAGNKLKEVLKSGSSKHWKETLWNFTGESNLNSGPLLEYFEPLLRWLKSENKKYPAENIGW